MIVDKILEWARERGYTAVYGSAAQVNEMLTDVDFAASKDATAVIMHLVTDSATVDGKDTAVVAVYFASLCDFDFDGESLLPEQERLKDIGKELLNDIRTGNEMTYSDPRWQYGYDDYAENVCWVCLRVTLTASAADCVPLSPEPPTPPPAPSYPYDLFCPQCVANLAPSEVEFIETIGKPSSLFISQKYVVCFASKSQISTEYRAYIPWIGNSTTVMSNLSAVSSIISDQRIVAFKNVMLRYGATMSEETERWLTERKGRYLHLVIFYGIGSGETVTMVAEGATHVETKTITVI